GGRGGGRRGRARAPPPARPSAPRPSALRPTAPRPTGPPSASRPPTARSTSGPAASQPPHGEGQHVVTDVERTQREQTPRGGAVHEGQSLRGLGTKLGGGDRIDVLDADPRLAGPPQRHPLRPLAEEAARDGEEPSALVVQHVDAVVG